MKEFMLAALPWSCIGIGIALCMVNHVAWKKAKEEGKDYDNYMGIGMCFGMCAGTIWGGNATVYGMLIGLIVGMFVKKEKHTGMESEDAEKVAETISGSQNMNDSAISKISELEKTT